MSIGSIVPWPVAGVPADWLACDGTAVSRATYAALFALVGVTYGPGDGATTFNLPDLRNRILPGVGSNVALAANEGLAEAARNPTVHNHPGGGNTANSPAGHVAPGAHVYAAPNTLAAVAPTVNVLAGAVFNGSTPADAHVHAKPAVANHGALISSFPVHLHAQGATDNLATWPAFLGLRAIIKVL